MARVRERRRRRLDFLRLPERRCHAGDVAVELPPQQVAVRAQRQHRRRQRAQRAERDVRRARRPPQLLAHLEPPRLPLRRALRPLLLVAAVERARVDVDRHQQPFVLREQQSVGGVRQFFLVELAAQVLLQRVRPRGGERHHRVRLAQPFAAALGLGGDARRQADEATRVGVDRRPELAAVPEALVGLLHAEGEEERDDGADALVRERRERQALDRRRHVGRQVAAARRAEQPGERRRRRHRPAEVARDALQDAAPPGREEHLEPRLAARLLAEQAARVRVREGVAVVRRLGKARGAVAGPHAARRRRTGGRNCGRGWRRNLRCWPRR